MNVRYMQSLLTYILSSSTQATSSYFLIRFKTLKTSCGLPLFSNHDGDLGQKSIKMKLTEAITNTIIIDVRI